MNIQSVLRVALFACLFWVAAGCNGLGCYIPGCVLLGAGSGCLAGSVPCLIIGSIRRNNSHEVYNETCGRRTSAVTFGLQSSQNGLGLAINF